MLRHLRMFLLLGVASCGAPLYVAIALAVDEPATAAGDKVTATAAADKAALAALQPYVGGWRGVGQPKRGSNDGSWIEESNWAWRFEDGHAELQSKAEKNKYFTLLRVQPGKTADSFVLLATKADADEPDRYTGAFDSDKQLVFSADKPREDLPARISLRQVAGGDRLLILYEKQTGENRYARLAEVGSTRKGSSFGKGGDGSPECIVTGGHGSIKVEYQDKPYYVCCTGCRDEFLEHPEQILAEYKERKAKKAAEK